jgi:hypothetical protein
MNGLCDAAPTVSANPITTYPLIVGFLNEIMRKIRTISTENMLQFSAISQLQEMRTLVEELTASFREGTQIPENSHFKPAITGPINFILQMTDGDENAVKQRKIEFQARLGEALKRDRDRQNLRQAKEKAFPFLMPVSDPLLSAPDEELTEEQRTLEAFVAHFVNVNAITHEEGRQRYPVSPFHSTLTIQNEGVWSNILGLTNGGNVRNNCENPHLQGWKVIEQTIDVPSLDENGKMVENDQGVIQTEQKTFQFPVYAATLSCGVMFPQGYVHQSWRGTVTRNIIFSADERGNVYAAFAKPLADEKMELTHRWKIVKRVRETSMEEAKKMAEDLWLSPSIAQTDNLRGRI